MNTEDEKRLSEFDRFSENYRELHNQNISITGEKSEYFAAYKAKFVAAKAASISQSRILDYGCGIGQICDHLKQLMPDARIDGYDISKGSLDQINSDLRAQGIFACEISELSRDYHVVIMANVLHHIRPEDRQAAVSGVAGLLCPGGKLVIFEHNPANPLTRRAVSSCPFDENAILLDSQETLGYVTQAGFRNVRREYIVFFPHVLRWLRPLETSLGWCPLGAQYAITGTRV